MEAHWRGVAGILVWCVFVAGAWRKVLELLRWEGFHFFVFHGVLCNFGNCVRCRELEWLCSSNRWVATGRFAASGAVYAELGRAGASVARTSGAM